MTKFKRELTVIQLKDGKYHLIGPVEEIELARLGWSGFSSYREGIDAITEYGYTEWNSNI